MTDQEAHDLPEPVQAAFSETDAVLDESRLIEDWSEYIAWAVSYWERRLLMEDVDG